MRRTALLLLQIVGCSAILYYVAREDIASAAEAATTRPLQIDPLAVRRLGLAEFLMLEKAPGTVIVDARSPEAFAVGHVPGAVNLPLETASDDPAALARLAPGPNLVVYCDDSGCLVSTRLARLIRERTGRNAMVYEGGWEEWSAVGMPHE